MPLVLSLRSGQDFFVDDERIVVATIRGKTRFAIEVPKTGKRYEISDAEATELSEIPDVFISAGDRPQSGVARVAIEAPHDMLILHGDKYRKGKP